MTRDSPDDDTASDDAVADGGERSDSPPAPQTDGAGHAGGYDGTTGGEPVHGREIETRQKYPNNRLFTWLDDRLELNHEILGKAFPEDKYGSFLLGEIALFSFIFLALTGSFLGLMYEPVASEVTYEGNAAEWAGQEVPGAFASVLTITYDTPFGMFLRMAHHWAAYIFIAAIALHMFRVFFSGAYRNPHEPNWFVGSVLLLLALAEGFFGYALPLDGFSKAATTIGFNMTGAVPVIGEWLQALAFGGAFPSQVGQVIPHMYFLHVFLFPALLVGIIGLHMMILMRQKHTEHAPSSRGGDRTPAADDDSFVVGSPLFPQQFLLSVVVLLLTAATISFLAALFPVQRIAAIGLDSPSSPSPDWFFMWVFGSLKMIPAELSLAGTTIVLGGWAEFIGGILIPMVIIGVMIVWPLIDNTDEPQHFTVDPLDRPAQTALGVGAIMLTIVLSIDGMRGTFSEVIGAPSSTLYPYLVLMTFAIPLLFTVRVYVWLTRRQRRLGRPTGPGVSLPYSATAVRWLDRGLTVLALGFLAVGIELVTGSATLASSFTGLPVIEQLFWLARVFAGLLLLLPVPPVYLALALVLMGLALGVAPAFAKPASRSTRL
ncbi:cytochrome b-561 [Halorientalis persicus]|uniref:Cytochrome b-561 n=1 Tax=Halorientalis persicus TaxID=1367881 RepID=A0A1H8I2J8_9EURY|nr:cytochrome bc complex cytochrome b subunit [Halorientalis persicus]SEN62783.1 cytochrome b-561 [Halorientalis persicus]